MEVVNMVVDLGIVMPVYKQKPEFLEAALQSVLNQTFQQFKFIIVIDGAPEMEPFIRSIVGDDHRVNIISYENNQGVPHALNTGFAELFKDKHIEYLTWVSSDNIYRPLFSEILYKAIKKGPDELGIVYSSFQSIDNHNQPLHDEHALAALRNFQGKPKEALLDSSIIGVSFMYKAKYAKMVAGGYSLAPIEDYDYWLKLTDFCEIKYIPIELMDYRVDSTFSVSSQLKTIEAHRKWRHAYHLTRHNTRVRRGIPIEITFLFILSEATTEAVARIEDLYEQVFSNYICHVIDLSEDYQVTTILQQIPHPCTMFEWLPTWDKTTAALYTVKKINTPYTMLLDLNPFDYVMNTQVLYDELRRAEESIWSTYYNKENRAIGYRNKHILAPMQTNELFRTPKLIYFLEEKMIKLGDKL